jgi:hypothetical protein
MPTQSISVVSPDSRSHLLLISSHLLMNQCNQAAEVTDMNHGIVVFEIENVSRQQRGEGGR